MKIKMIRLISFALLLSITGCGPADATDLINLLEKGLFLSMGTLFLAGVLTSFTPCVYPLIPITVGLFGARKSLRKMHAFTLSLAYTLGISVMYTTLGIIAALTGTLFGNYMTSIPVIGIIVAIFFLTALSMAGVFEIKVPSWLMSRVTRIGGIGHEGAFLMGLASGFVAAPCTGPVLAAILAYVATTKSIATGAMMLFSYSIGIGMLFIIIGTFSGITLPRSGRWMEVIKSVFAVIMFAVGFYYLQNIFPPLNNFFSTDQTGFFTALTLTAAGIFAGGLHLDVGSSGILRKTRKTISSLAVGAGLFGLILNVYSGTSPSPGWRYDWKNAISYAKESSRPAIVDFYADWCSACKDLDRKTWSSEEVILESTRFVMIRIDSTFTSSDAEDDYDVVGLPTIIFLDSSGNQVESLRLSGFVTPEGMLEKMKSVK